ncbi:hypothetical protein EDD85DRAFT_228561 [Armillaria nabsnona]|nr:hypothetical protein EDD85DRAFT_228561 [Armillaria nabsnona]
MEFFNRKQIAHGNASRSSSLSLLSSIKPAQAVGSPLNVSDAASVKGKGKFSRIFRRQRKRGYTDTTGDVLATSSDSESPVLHANTGGTTTAYQPLANAQTTATKDSPANNNLADTASGNKIANAAVIVEIVQSVCEVLDNVPYVKVVTGLLTTLIKTINVCHHLAVNSLY